MKNKIHPYYHIPKMILLTVLFITACQLEHHAVEDQKIIAEINKYRSEKDSLFLWADWSPIPKYDKVSFRGLNYFPIDLSLRFEGQIILHEPPTPDTIVGTKGDLRPALKYGYFPFSYKNQSYKLNIYQILPEDSTRDKYLFLGFTDQTTGKETYDTGRYIDMVEIPNQRYVVDFNLAYNPYCAYNPRYTCAIPPSENRLPFKILAGEKIFRKH
ncbi:MAG: DUF1684 domain-containing protein [Calditrichota bacterium]|jgi:uncharacterized protein (DUF1684 family)